MPGYDDVTVNFTTSTYQSINGDNFTTAGCDMKFDHGVGMYTGIGTDFHSKPVIVVDMKGSGQYGNSVFQHNLRVRTKVSDKTFTSQIRVSPLSINVPLSDKTSIYANPHYSGTYDFDKKNWKHSAGIFGGITQKINDNTKISLEAQRYNLQDIKDNSGKNWSINAVVSVTM